MQKHTYPSCSAKAAKAMASPSKITYNLVPRGHDLFGQRQVPVARSVGQRLAKATRTLGTRLDHLQAANETRVTASKAGPLETAS